MGPGAWNNVQGTETKRTNGNDEAEDYLQAGAAKKRRLLEEQQRDREREEDLRSKEHAGNLGKPSNHDSLARMTKGLDKWGLLTMVSSFRVAEAMQHRCGNESNAVTGGVNEVEDAARSGGTSYDCRQRGGTTLDRTIPDKDARHLPQEPSGILAISRVYPHEFGEYGDERRLYGATATGQRCDQY